jgi:hypothetical protein
MKVMKKALYIILLALEFLQLLLCTSNFQFDKQNEFPIVTAYIPIANISILTGGGIYYV